ASRWHREITCPSPSPFGTEQPETATAKSWSRSGMTCAWNNPHEPEDDRHEPTRFFENGPDRGWYEPLGAETLGFRRPQRRESAERLPVARLGADLSRSVPVRFDLHLGVCPQRHAHVPVACLRAQRHPAAERAELRP